MHRIIRLIDHYGNPLNWDTATRATLLLALCLAAHSQYLFWALYQVSPLAPASNEQYVNVAFIESQIPYFSLLWFFSLALFLFVLLQRKRYPNANIFEYLATQYYAITLSFCSFLIGNMSVATGIVIAGAPVVGLIFFNARAVMLALFVSLGSQALISYGCAIGAIPYAPVMNDAFQSTGLISEFWIINLYIFSAPHMIVLIVVAYYALTRWRQRESEIRMLSLTDQLTQLSNRRSILVELGKELARAERLPEPSLSVVLIDLDHFKHINDTYGHAAGDLVLKSVAKILKDSIRHGDHVGRYGGEEFLIVFPDTTTEQALRLAERCRAAIIASPILVDCNTRLKVTASMGLENLQNLAKATPESLLHNADIALYSAKNNGRNQVVVYHTD